MRRRWQRTAFGIAYVLLLFGLVEIGARAFWAMRWGVPFFHPSRAATTRTSTCCCSPARR
jgi:hypothetical protein